MGNRYELNVGFDAGLGVGFTGIKAPVGDGKSVYGIGYSVGVGVSATIVDINLNYGTTSRSTPWKK